MTAVALTTQQRHFYPLYPMRQRTPQMNLHTACMTASLATKVPLSVCCFTCLITGLVSENTYRHSGLPLQWQKCQQRHKTSANMCIQQVCRCIPKWQPRNSENFSERKKKVSIEFCSSLTARRPHQFRLKYYKRGIAQLRNGNVLEKKYAKYVTSRVANKCYSY